MASESPKKPFRWKRWLLRGVLALVLAIPASWFGFGAYSDLRLQHEIDRYHAAGEPILPGDFVPKGVPDNQNAALLLRRAGQQLVFEDSIRKELDTWGPQRLPLSDREMQIIAHLQTANAESIALTHESITRPDSWWDAQYVGIVGLFNSQAIEQTYTQQRRLAQVLAMGARREHQLGRDDQAFKLLTSAIRQADAFEHYSASMTGHLLSIGIIGLVADALLDMSPDLAIGSLPGAVSESEVRAMIQLLLDDRAQRVGWINAMNGERALMLDSKAIYSHEYLVKIMQLRLVRTLDNATALREAGLLPTYPLARSAMAERLRQMNQKSWLPDSTTMFMPTELRGLETCFKGLTDRRLAAASLALRCYRLVNGNFPKTLEELVPRYLPTAPADPMSPTSALMRYAPDAEKPMLYSLGTDMIDGGGSLAVYTLMQPNVQPNRWDLEDDIAFLVRQPRPASQPANR